MNIGHHVTLEGEQHHTVQELYAEYVLEEESDREETQESV